MRGYSYVKGVAVVQAAGNEGLGDDASGAIREPLEDFSERAIC